MRKGEHILLYLSFISTGLVVLQANSSLWIGRQSRKINTLKQFPLILIGLLLIAPNIYSQNEAFEKQLKDYFKSSLPNIENRTNNGFLENEIFKYLSYKILKNKSNDSTSLIEEVTGKLTDGSEFKYSYSYDPNGNQSITLYATWDGSQWVSSFQITNTYDSDGKLTLLLYETWDGVQWENAIQLTNTYDSNGNQTLYLLETWDGSQWVNNSQTKYTYDSNGNEILSILERWDGSQWVNSFQLTNTYNSNGNQILSIIQTWDGSQWVNNSQTKYTYDSNGNQIISLNETWNGSQFVTFRQTKNTYDSNGNQTLSLLETWNGSQFVNVSQTKNTYDSNENQTLSLIETWDGIQWVNNSRIIFTYDSNGNMILGLSEKFESNNWVAANGSIRFEDSFGRTESYFASEINVTYLILDVEAPVITHTPIQQAEANQAITITANISDNEQVSNAQMSYSKAGESNFITLNMTANGSVYSSDIPSSEVTLAGIEYFITAADTSGNDIREPASGVFSIQVSIEDVEAPVITHTPIQQAEANQTITITANISDNEQVSNAQLFYRKGGEINFKSLTLEASGNTFSGDIPINEVTLRGLEYFLTSTDALNNSSRDPANGVIALQVSVSGEGLVKETAQPSGSAQTAYRLITFPLDIDNKNSTSIFNDDLGNYDKTKWRMFELENAQTYKENSSSLKIKPGIAYWLIVNDANKKIDTGPAKSIKTNEPYAIPLNAGWTFIGNPFNYSIPLANLSLANNQTFTIEFYSGSWNPFGGSIQPFEGYALFTESATELLINPALTNSNLAKDLSKENVKSLWEINIVATCQAAMDLTNVVALVPSSSKSWDKHDRPEPPVIGDYISLYFPHNDWDKISKSYSKDARPVIGDGDIWDIEVRTNVKDIINLSFENIESLPTNYEIKLIDEKFQMVKDLISSSKYSLNGSNNDAPRKLKLIIGNKEFVNKKIEQIIIAPTTFQLFQNYPNPFNPTTAIRYTISNAEPIHDLSVQLKIYDMLGKEVATLVDKQQSPGNYEVEFNGNNISSGIYYYQIKIGKFVETRKMILLK
jgi:Secretion system C-terminal sorting domain